MPTTDDPSVVVLVGQVPGSQFATLCTATVVSPHVVLTAAHCVDPDVVGGNAKFSVLLGPVIDHPAASDYHSVAEVHYHPDFDKNDVTKGGDIGVAVLDKALDLPPRPMNRSHLTTEMIGQSARLVGYGQTSGTDTTGATAGVRRVATTVMGSYTDKLVNFGTPGTGTCEGDSGGPAFMTVDGTEVIVGVVSFGDQACAELGVDTRVDVFAQDWVDPFIMSADPDMVLPRSSSGGCTLGGPAPCGVATLALALALAWLIARQKLRYVRSAGIPRGPSASRTPEIIPGMPHR
jgi:secreted trypsin-like serine protease